MPQIRKSFVSFNVGVMMKACREVREEAAISYASVQQLRKPVDAVAVKRRRLENRVSHSSYSSLGLIIHNFSSSL